MTYKRFEELPVREEFMVELGRMQEENLRELESKAAGRAGTMSDEDQSGR